jgi:ATP phosphoribosyltransferase regulatory subunit
VKTESVPPQAALAAIRQALSAAGAQAVDAPLLQPLSLLLDLAGEAMRARLFVVQAEAGAEACLRPDFTVAVALAHIEAGRPGGRYIYEGPAFRASGEGEAAEEFLQMGLELMAPAGAAREPADAEIAGLAWQAAAAGGRKDLSLWLGDVGLLAPFIDSLGLAAPLAARLKRVAGRPRLLQAELGRAGSTPAAPSERSRLAELLAGLPAEEAAGLLEELWALAGIEPVGGRGPAEIAARLARSAGATETPALGEGQAEAISAFMAISDAPDAAFAAVRALAGRKAQPLETALAGWRERLDRLSAAASGAPLCFAPALGHAFDYYDGVTFEVRSAALGAGRPVAVGGRYDGLLTRLGDASNAGAVGCMVRPWRAYSGGEA